MKDTSILLYAVSVLLSYQFNNFHCVSNRRFSDLYVPRGDLRHILSTLHTRFRFLKNSTVQISVTNSHLIIHVPFHAIKWYKCYARCIFHHSLPGNLMHNAMIEAPGRCNVYIRAIYSGSQFAAKNKQFKVNVRHNSLLFNWHANQP